MAVWEVLGSPCMSHCSWLVPQQSWNCTRQSEVQVSSDGAESPRREVQAGRGLSAGGWAREVAREPGTKSDSFLEENLWRTGVQARREMISRVEGGRGKVASLPGVPWLVSVCRSQGRPMTPRIVSSRHNRTGVHIDSQRLRQQAHDMHRFKPDGVPAPRRPVDTGSHPLSRSSLQLIPSGKGKTGFLQWSVIGYMSHTPGQTRAQE